MSAVDQYRLETEQNSVRLHLDIPPYVPEIPSDPRSLERALAAILDNAIKFSTDNIAGHLFGGIGGVILCPRGHPTTWGKITMESFPPGSAEGKGSTFTVHLTM